MQTSSRKRRAPGADPDENGANASRITDVSDPSQLSNDQFLSWSAGDDLANNELSRLAQYSPSFSLADGGGQLVRRGFGNNSALQTMARQFERTSPALDESDEDDNDLEARALAAKRDALSRKPARQIPPFIQKLQSNYDLIRWSDDGRAFNILDEDKFANDLIPLMFKHNNYSSFVRQLNMYGFHKKVGLSDNSMRASEKKTKIPSGYQHKYFRRGRPELLWLIEKPKPSTVAGKKRAGKDDDDAEETTSKPGPGNANAKDLISVPRSELTTVRNLQNEVEALQRSQHQIYAILKQMRDENNQYIKQASAMVANHDRHESSINAILQFLATFYNQSLGGNDQGGMFAGASPNQRPGNVVEDMGDYNGDTPTEPRYSATPQPLKRPLLLPAPRRDDDDDARSTRAGSRPRESAASSVHSSPRASNRRDDMLNVINRRNAQTPKAQFDFGNALRQYSSANGSNAPLTPEQRDNVLAIMANSGTLGDNDASQYLDYLNANQDQLDLLAKMQDEQDSRVADLAGRLQPLSPSGSIPGLDRWLNTPSPGPGAALPDYDFSNFINDDEELGVGLDAGNAAAGGVAAGTAPAEADEYDWTGGQDGADDADANGETADGDAAGDADADGAAETPGPTTRSKRRRT